MDAYEKRRFNDLTGLGWLHRSGWLRTAELGRLLWPHNKTSQQQADRLARSWLERHLVLARDLPEGAGRALVLATGGVRLLADHGIEASSGKDLGQVAGQEWTPPLSWRHQLLAAGILARLHQSGWTVYPEREIRQRAGWLAKVPDGLAVQGSTVAWLEVERAVKTGKPGRDLAEALCAVSDGQAATVLGHRPTVGLVAYQADARDSRGCALDHRARVKAAVAVAAKQAVRVWWAQCRLRGPAGLGDLEITEELIQSDRAAAIRKRMEWTKDATQEGVLVAGYEDHLAYVWEDEEPGWWGYQVDNLPGDRAPTEEAAKRACAGVLASLSS